LQRNDVPYNKVYISIIMGILIAVICLHPEAIMHFWITEVITDWAANKLRNTYELLDKLMM